MLLLFLTLALPQAPAEVQQVQREALASWREWRFTRIAETERLAEDGSVRSREVLKFEITPVDDGFDERLVAIDGREPTPDEVRAHRKAGRFAERYATSLSTDEDARFSLRHLLELRTFERAGVETVGGVECERLDFSPSRLPSGASLGRRIAAAMEGSLWIRRQGSHVVRARGETTRPVKVAGGLAEVKRLAIAVDQAAVGEHFLPSRIEVQRTVRILFGTRVRREVFRYSGFKSVDSTFSH